MKLTTKIAATVLAVSLFAAPAFAWKLVKRGEGTVIAKSALVVTAEQDWNRVTSGYAKNSEIWTLDGTTLNELYLIGGAPANATLFYELDKKNNPLPRFTDQTTLTDLPDLVERSWRVGRRTAVFKLGTIEPAKLGGRDAVRIAYEYVSDNSHLTYKGLLTAAIVDKKLYIIDFEAPALYFFDRDKAKAEAVMASAKF